MKQLISICLLLSLSTGAIAQQTNSKENTKKQYRSKPPVCYIGFSMGINNPSGVLGFDVNIPLTSNVTLDGGAGTSTWGNKLYVGGKYYLRSPQRGFAFGGGLTFNSGADNFKTRLETIYNDRQEVTLNLKSQANIFLGAYHYWTVGKYNNRFYLELGRSIPLTGVHFEQINVNGNPITENSHKAVNILAPGGFMFGFGFSFALYNKRSGM
ncbi:hypothetical protein CJD36_013900 [Flavipsychrobacter stenotrophus]|uniref:Outer membrane protein beta-barrel domain-containing protein n=1 Tax=Flavipsychrobacter stenotrophus TaxID=2077091 RepID=A0A2S7SWG8_9BACT|nr:hypothetical protein [Flavipsychrobacter stenotrophus]PQJ11058.1 hypothetical protein CJD36_013900 [Flavipsychrobacter stenotrophus]